MDNTTKPKQYIIDAKKGDVDVRIQISEDSDDMALDTAKRLVSADSYKIDCRRPYRDINIDGAGYYPMRSAMPIAFANLI